MTISDSLSGAAIHFTSDGTPPTVNSSLYSGPIMVTSSRTIQAIAVAAGRNNSAVGGGAYTIGSAPTINFSNGFASVAGLTLNGSTVNSDDSRLQLTTGGTIRQAASFGKPPSTCRALCPTLLSSFRAIHPLLMELLLRSRTVPRQRWARPGGAGLRARPPGCGRHTE